MKSFLAVAEDLHFTRAAERLRVAQPNLSQEIRRLEREIGVDLFARTKRSVALTPAGHTFLQHVRALLNATADAVHATQRASRGEIGRIRLGMVSAATFSVIPNAIGRFRAAYPNVEILLSELYSVEAPDALRTGRLDLCVLHPPRNVEVALNIVSIWDEQLVAALSPKHPLAGIQRIGLSTLRSEPWVLWPREMATRLYDEVIAACAAAGFEPRVVQRATRVTTVASMVAAGLGVALLPITVARLGIGGATFRPLRPPRVSVPVAFAWRQSETAPELAHFMAIVRASVPRRRTTLIQKVERPIR